MIIDNQPKKNIGILFGGTSAEHEVSVMSARSVYEAIDKSEYEPHLFGVDKKGHWHLLDASVVVADDMSLHKYIHTCSLGRLHISSKGNGLRFYHEVLDVPEIDVFFPVTHGPKGEDGTIQGLLELMNTPYVGPGVLSSAVGMDKDVSKRLLRDAGIRIADHFILRRHDASDYFPSSDTLDYPLFVKPASLGSSIGVSKVKNEKELLAAIEHGFRYDRKIIIEEAVTGMEIECAVMGNANPTVSVPGRIHYQSEFYDYNAKYGDDSGTTLEIPADLSPKVSKQVQEISIKAYQALECEGLARVDMFVTSDGEIYVNEVNTLPGFTKFSMYPQLWEASGLTYSKLITQLIDHTLENESEKRYMDTHDG